MSERVRCGTTARILGSLASAVAFATSAGQAAEDAKQSPDPAIDDVVFVTATRGDRPLLDVGADTMLIDRAEIERSGVATIPDLLRRQPGLFVTSFTTNPAGVTVEARGFNNGGALGSGLLVLVDGRRLNEADTANTDWALIPLERVDRIEIVLGSASAIYGDNAVGGVIHIRTRPYSGPRAVLRARAGSFDAQRSSLDAQGGIGNLHGGLFASRSTTDGFRERSAYRDENLEADLEWSGARGLRIGGRGGYHQDDRELPGALDPVELATLGRDAADPDSARDESENRRIFGQGWFEVDLVQDVQFAFHPHFNERKDDVVITSIVFGATTIETEKQSWGGDVKLQSDVPFLGFQNRLITGAELLRESTERVVDSAFGVTISDNEREVLSAYVQDEFWIHERVLLTGGVRLDHASYELETLAPDVPVRDVDRPSFEIWSPRGSITFRVAPSVSVFGGYSKGFRLPNFDENAPVVGFTSLVPDLDPQISETYEFGVKHHSEQLRAALVLYQMEVRDEILFDPFTFENTNLDHVRHRGLNAWLSAHCGWLRGHANYTLDDVTVRRAGEGFEHVRMPITPVHRGNVGLTLELPHEVEVGGHLNVVGRRILSNDFDRRLERLGAYEVLDLVAAWKPSFGEHAELAFTFAARNLLDEEYDDFGARFDVGFPGVPTPFVNPAAERRFEGGVALTIRR